MVSTQINPRDFPDSPYALELERTRPDLRFVPPLEAEYSLAHLRRVRLRVRLWFMTVLVVRFLFALSQVRASGVSSLDSLLQLLVLLPCSACLVCLTWGPY